MRRYVGGAFLVLLLAVPTPCQQPSPDSQADQQPAQAVQAAAAPSGPTLEDGTPIKLRIARTVSSADAQVGDTVDFFLAEEVKVGNTVVIPKGGIAWAKVVEAKPKRRLARGGKLRMNIESVRLADGEKVPLRAVQEVKGGGPAGAMTGGIIATGIVFFPAAPLFLFMHGKEVIIPMGTEITAYIHGNVPIDLAKFVPPAPAAAPQVAAATEAVLEITSTPVGAEIELNGNFVGNTPSSVNVAAGEHTLKLTKSGHTPWEKKIKTSGGKVTIAAELQPATPPLPPPQP